MRLIWVVVMDSGAYEHNEQTIVCAYWNEKAAHERAITEAKNAGLTLKAYAKHSRDGSVLENTEFWVEPVGLMDDKSSFCQRKPSERWNGYRSGGWYKGRWIKGDWE